MVNTTWFKELSILMFWKPLEKTTWTQETNYYLIFATDFQRIVLNLNEDKYIHFLNKINNIYFIGIAGLIEELKSKWYEV